MYPRRPEAAPARTGKSRSRSPTCARRTHAIAAATTNRSRHFRERARLQQSIRSEHAREHAADAELARDLEAPLMQLQYVLDDRETEAGAAGLARSAGRHAVEPFGQTRQMLRGNALAGVGHRQTSALR